MRLEKRGYQVHQEVASAGKFVDIGILDDSVTEQTEVFSISLESVSGEGIFNQSAIVSILDDGECTLLSTAGLILSHGFFLSPQILCLNSQIYHLRVCTSCRRALGLVRFVWGQWES